MNSRNKGKRGELLLAEYLREHGYSARRGQQYSGIGGADVVGLPGAHIECKWVERESVRKWVEQAKRDAQAGEMPVVFHKVSRGEWLVTLPAEEFLKVYQNANVM